MDLEDYFQEEEEIAKELKYEVNSYVVLHWNYRGLRYIPDDVFKCASHVEELTLRNNLLRELPITLCGLTGLKLLYIKQNNLEYLPESIGNLVNLTVLDLLGNCLTKIPTSIANLKNLTYLNLVNNKLESLPKEIGDLSSLQFLLISANKLSYLPNELSKLSSLLCLNVERNKIRLIPEGVPSLDLLSSACFHKNNLLRFPLSKFCHKTADLTFYGNPNLNYLNKSMFLKLLKEPISSNSLPINPKIDCFEDPNMFTNNDFFVSTEMKSTDKNVFVLPSNLRKITNSFSYKFREVTPLFEICLRLISSVIRNDSTLANRLSLNDIYGQVPSNIFELIKMGPITKCDLPSCSNYILSYSSVTIIKVPIINNDLNNTSKVPLILFFCCDCCAHNLKFELENMDPPFNGSDCIIKALENRYEYKKF